MALEAYCASCTYLKEESDSFGRYWCTRKGENHYACDPKCNSWLEAYSRYTSARENMYRNSSSHCSGGGCYLTTIMCEILNLPDDNYYLQTLRTFRDTVLKQDIKYYPLLITYDVIGPQIAEKLANDPNRKEIANAMLNNFINKSVTAIEENKIEEATNIYVAMTNSLAEQYNINTQILTIDTTNINLETLGHGKSRKRTYVQPAITFIPYE